MLTGRNPLAIETAKADSVEECGAISSCLKSTIPLTNPDRNSMSRHGLLGTSVRSTPMKTLAFFRNEARPLNQHLKLPRHEQEGDCTICSDELGV
jgi:hypothetical protein